jgi:REP element-mobilizing transposase RayT
VVFHLADSLPEAPLLRLMQLLRALPPEERSLKRQNHIERWADRGYGCCVLRDDGVADLVRSALEYFDGDRYSLGSWTIMPSHVHCLVRPFEGWTTQKIVSSWKQFTARRIQAQVRRGELPGVSIDDVRPLWHREYFDRFIRDLDHYRQTVRYIENNPVKAKLVGRAEDWPWGSAYRRPGRD